MPAPDELLRPADQREVLHYEYNTTPNWEIRGNIFSGTVSSVDDPLPQPEDNDLSQASISNGGCGSVTH
jgi:hypothetical protein